MKRIADGDRAAFEALYERHAARLSRFVHGLMSRPDLADEVINDTMVVVWRTAGRFRGESRVGSWILGIAYRVAMKGLRRASRRPEDGFRGELVLVDPSEPEANLLRRQLRVRVRQALARLSPDHRAVLELAFDEGLSCREIAGIVGCPVNTVKTRMFYARRHLRDLLEADTRQTRERGD